MDTKAASAGPAPTHLPSSTYPATSPYSKGARSSHQYFSLRWNNYQSNMTSVFHELLESQSFVDVTLACEYNSLKAHKVRRSVVLPCGPSPAVCRNEIHCLWPSSHFATGGSVGVFGVLSKNSPGQPVQASDHHTAGRYMLFRSAVHHRVRVPRGNRCIRGRAAGRSFSSFYVKD